MQLESSSLLSHSRHPPSIFHPYSSPECPPNPARPPGGPGWFGQFNGNKPAHRRPCRDVPPLDWTKNNRIQRGFGRVAGIVEKKRRPVAPPKRRRSSRAKRGIWRRWPERVQFASRLEFGEAQPAHGFMPLSAPNRIYLRINKIYAKRLVDKFYT